MAFISEYQGLGGIGSTLKRILKAGVANAKAREEARVLAEEANYRAREEKLTDLAAEEILQAENRKKMLIWGAGGIALFLVLRKK